MRGVIAELDSAVHQLCEKALRGGWTRGQVRRWRLCGRQAGRASSRS